MTLMQRYPSVADLERRARRRIPRFAWDYLAGGSGQERLVARNREAFDRVLMTPRFFVDVSDTDLSVELFGTRYAMPIGVAPIGQAGLVWPGVETMLARAAKKAGIPYLLSTVSTAVMEDIGAIGGDHAWFQLYPPADRAIEKDLIARAQASGFGAMIVTIDVPVQARRLRDIRNGFSVPPRINWLNIVQAALAPAWSIATLRHGLPYFRTVEPYVDDKADMKESVTFLRDQFTGPMSREHFGEIRRLWQGPLIVKGIQHPDDARLVVDLGADGIIVSNHGGRQLDGERATIDVLPEIVEAVGDKTTVMLDSGIRSGLDVVRGLAHGAQFTFSGRSFMFAIAALGEAGGDHVIEILHQELLHVLGELGCPRAADMDAAWLTTPWSRDG